MRSFRQVSTRALMALASPLTLERIFASPFSKVIMGLSPRASPTKAAAGVIRPDFFTQRRFRGMNMGRVWATHS